MFYRDPYLEPDNNLKLFIITLYLSYFLPLIYFLILRIFWCIMHLADLVDLLPHTLLELDETCD